MICERTLIHAQSTLWIAGMIKFNKAELTELKVRIFYEHKI